MYTVSNSQKTQYLRSIELDEAISHSFLRFGIERHKEAIFPDHTKLTVDFAYHILQLLELLYRHHRQVIDNDDVAEPGLHLRIDIVADVVVVAEKKNDRLKSEQTQFKFFQEL